MKNRSILRHTLFIVCAMFIAPAQAGSSIVLATTTSTQNSGLLDAILPDFTQQTGIEIKVIAVGTGKALRMGCDGDADVVLVHAANAEKKFIADGCGQARNPVMYNDFVIVGPQGDPAKLHSAQSLVDAMKHLQQASALFVSRGDDSGTHKKERSLWKIAGIIPGGNRYREAGQGMGKVLQMAGELNAYTLTDRGTWLAFKNKSPLSIAFEGDASLNNPYSIIPVSPIKYPDINAKGAEALTRWIRSDATQALIGNFKVNGEKLFNPSANTVSN